MGNRRVFLGYQPCFYPKGRVPASPNLFWDPYLRPNGSTYSDVGLTVSKTDGGQMMRCQNEIDYNSLKCNE